MSAVEDARQLPSEASSKFNEFPMRKVLLIFQLSASGTPLVEVTEL